jgi:hypothetical protein
MKLKTRAIVVGIAASTVLAACTASESTDPPGIGLVTHEQSTPGDWPFRNLSLGDSPEEIADATGWTLGTCGGAELSILTPPSGDWALAVTTAPGTSSDAGAKRFEFYSTTLGATEPGPAPDPAVEAWLGLSESALTEAVGQWTERIGDEFAPPSGDPIPIVRVTYVMENVGDVQVLLLDDAVASIQYPSSQRPGGAWDSALVCD